MMDNVQTEFVLEVEHLELRTLLTAIVPGGRRGKLTAGGMLVHEFASPDQGDCNQCPPATVRVDPIIEPTYV